MTDSSLWENRDLVFDDALIAKYDQSGPRYTSYPTAVQFHDGFGPAEYRAAATASAVEIVLNRADSKVWLNPEEVERAIGRPIEIRIPSDRVVPRSVNKGTPVVTEAPRSDVSRTIISLVKHTVDSLEEVAADVA